MKKNMLDWHFSFTGVEGTPYEGGVYHGTISLDQRYPRKAPVIRMSTASGRWKVNEDICLSGILLSHVLLTQIKARNVPITISTQLPHITRSCGIHRGTCAL